jgi:DNA-binding transcriptional ArsR family regulator
VNGSLRDLANIDKLIHEPSRLAIVSILNEVQKADFLFLQRETGFTKGNLSSHLAKLEAADYVRIEKSFQGRKPLTVCSLTEDGRAAYGAYLKTMRDFVTRKRKKP